MLFRTRLIQRIIRLNNVPGARRPVSTLRTFASCVSVSMTTKSFNQCCFKNVLGCGFSTAPEKLISSTTFEKVCEETLDSLSEYIEELVENAEHLHSADVTYSSGVLTVNFGPEQGTYVINRQSPNRQIWLSSPISGPKRYDFVEEGKCWIYKHDGCTLHTLLQQEFEQILHEPVDFSKCAYSKC